MTVFYRKVKVWDMYDGYGLSTETIDERQYKGTLEECVKWFAQDFGIRPTQLVELKGEY